MSRTGDQFGGPAKQRSGWLIPFVVFVVTAALSAVILAYYLLPRPPPFLAEQPAPTDSTQPVELSIGGIGFYIPANYILYAGARRGGALSELAMVALLPSLEGYSLAAAQDFSSNTPDSRVVNIVIREDALALSDAGRLSRIYLPVAEASQGTPAGFGVTAYGFRADSGYRDEELYVAQSDEGPMLLRCTKADVNVPSPSCLGDISLGGRLVLAYRFKRAHLADWQAIEAGLSALAGAFMDKS